MAQEYRLHLPPPRSTSDLEDDDNSPSSPTPVNRGAAGARRRALMAAAHAQGGERAKRVNTPPSRVAVNNADLRSEVPVGAGGTSSNHVKLIVGSEGKPFILYKSTLAQHSPSFFGVLFSTNSGAGTQVVHLEEVPVEDFQRFMHWLYTSRIEQVNPVLGADLIPLARLWILSEFLKVPALQNQVISLLQSLLSTSPPDQLAIKEFLVYAYGGKWGERAQLKGLAVDYVAWKTTPEELDASAGQLPARLSMDVLMRLKEGHEPGNPACLLRGGSDYYV